jgi:hypothetical protein
MKTLVFNYSFDASAKQITFTDYTPVLIERVLLITNATDGIIIYNFADPTKLGTCATNVLTLAYNTTTMSDTDKLQIFYDDPLSTSATNEQLTSLITPLLVSDDTLAGVTTVGTITNVVHVDDNGGTLTVDGTVGVTGVATETTLAAINTKMVSGTDIGDVTINNATGAAAVNIQDGGNTITVDGTVAVTNADLTTLAGAVSATHLQVDVLSMPAGGSGLTDAELRATAVPISVATIPSHAVTNAGTFATQSTLAAETTKVIGTVNVAAAQTIAVTNADMTTVAGMVSGGHGQVDVLTMPSTAVTNADITSCKTALELLDNSVDGNYLNVNMNLAGTDCPSGNGTAATSQRVTIASDSTGQVKLAASSGVDIGKLTANQSVNNAQINGVTPLMGNGATGTGSQRVTIASDNTAFNVIDAGDKAHDAADGGNPIKVGGRASTTPVTAVSANDRVDAFFDVQGRQVVAQKALTGTLSNVNASASNVTLLAANTARLGATFYNDSTAILYLKLGATASATSFTVKMQADAYYEIPFGYYGIVDGISTAATGVVRVTEVT